MILMGKLIEEVKLDTALKGCRSLCWTRARKEKKREENCRHHTIPIPHDHRHGVNSQRKRSRKTASVTVIFGLWGSQGSWGFCRCVLPSKLPTVNGWDTLPAAKPSGGEEMEAAQAATVPESPPDTGD